MPNDPLFDVTMPTWWRLTAMLIRGLALGFLMGYLFSLVVAPTVFDVGPAIIVTACLIVAAMTSLPKAWIEQRNRLRAARDGTLMEEVEKRRRAR